MAKAKLINSALMAKIHTVEWTPAIMPHPIIQLAMNTNWYGLAGEELQEVFEFLERQRDPRRHRRLEARSPCRALFADRGVRLGLPHAPAHPRRVLFRSLANDAELETIELPDMVGPQNARPSASASR